MAYIGSTPTSQNFISGTDYFNGTGSQTTFTLTRSVNSVNDVEVVVNNVIQQPNSYIISGTTLTLSAAPSSGTSNVYVRYLATNQQSFTVGNNTVGYNQLTADAQQDLGISFKNRIINGDMRINQRGYNGSIGDQIYTLDRWVCDRTGGSATATVSQSSVAPSGYINSLLYTVGTGATTGATDYSAIRQYIEGLNTADFAFGTSSAKTVTLSFWVRSSVTGTFGVCLSNSAYNRNYIASYTINAANTWEQKTVTVPGDTTGTWLTTNGTGIRVIWDLGVGSTYSTSAGAWSGSVVFGLTGGTKLSATSGATFYITGAQLEVGTQATTFDCRAYGTELALCQRYYSSTSMYFTEGRYFPTPYKQQMRVSPTITFSSGQITNQGATADGITIYANTGIGNPLNTFYANAEL